MQQNPEVIDIGSLQVQHNLNKQDCRKSREDQQNYDPCATASVRLAQDGRWKPTLIPFKHS